MQAEALIYPALKDAAWTGASACVARRLAAELDSPYLPWLAFGYDHPHTFEFLSTERFATMGMSREELEARAIDNLRQRSGRWQREDIDLGGAGRLPLLLCQDDYLAAERIVEPGFLVAAQGLLGAEVLAVGAPRKGILAATDGGADRQVLGTFAAMISAQYHRAESAPITPMVFAVTEGRIVGMLSGGEELGKRLAAEEADEREIYVQGLVLEDPDTGLQEIALCVGGENLEKLFQVVQAAVAHTLQESLGDETFSGTIRVVVLGGLTPDTPRVRGALDKLETHLNGVVRDLGAATASGRPVRVVFEWREEGPLVH